MPRHFAGKPKPKEPPPPSGLPSGPPPELSSGPLSEPKDSRGAKRQRASASRPGLEEPAGDPPEPSSFLSQLRQSKRLKQPPKYVAAPIPARPLAFNEPGKYVNLAARDRLEASLGDCEHIFVKKDPPRTEWWDLEVVVGTHISHPEQLPPSWEQYMPSQVPIRLTKEEQKRKRKVERALHAQEVRERVAQGLEPPPPPKLARSNVMAVMGAEYLKDPTKYDQLAAKAESERRAKHEHDNAARRKSSDQKWQAQKAKIESHQAAGVFSTVYVVTKFDSKHKFIVDYTAKKFLFTGACIAGPQFTLVVVEGSEPEMRKFGKLMLKRIEWPCRVVWQGQLAQHNFSRWSLHEFDDATAVQFLATRGCSSYWQLAAATAASD